jgi:hypothetical protein
VRTTLSIDDDIAHLLNQEISKNGKSLKQTINHLLRLGLMQAGKPQPSKPFTVTPRPLGLPPGLSYDNIGDLLEALEGPDHK